MGLNYETINDGRVRAYAAATEITQDFLDATFRGQETQLEAVAEIEKGALLFRVSDRPKYVGNDFYAGRAVLPKILRTLGELLAPEIKFADARVGISNVDGAYNRYLPGGADFLSFIGAQMRIKFGIRDVAASYVTFFQGDVKEDKGVVRSKQALTFSARDRFERYNARFNLPVITSGSFPDAPQDALGKAIPFVLGNWSVGCNLTLVGEASVNDGASNVQVKTYAPLDFYGGALGIPTAAVSGGSVFVVAIGNGTNVDRVPFLDPSNSDCFIKRGEVAYKVAGTPAVASIGGYYQIAVSDIEGVSGDVNYVYQQGDMLIAPLIVPYNASGDTTNVIAQAQDILGTFLGLDSGDFDSTWATYAAKATPSQSAIANISSRVWIGKNEDTVLEYVLGMLEQVRLEAFPKVDGTLSISSLHFEDWPAPEDSFLMGQFDFEEEGFSIESDDRTFFNAAQGQFGFTPITTKTELKGSLLTNSNSVTLSGKLIDKAITFNNLYVRADVDAQVTELVRLFSSGLDYIKVTTSWRFLLRELGTFLSLSFDLAGLSFDQAPAQIRDLEIDFATGSVSFKLLSLQSFGYPEYTPTGTTLSSASQSIT